MFKIYLTTTAAQSILYVLVPADLPGVKLHVLPAPADVLYYVVPGVMHSLPTAEEVDVQAQAVLIVPWCTKLVLVVELELAEVVAGVKLDGEVVVAHLYKNILDKLSNNINSSSSNNRDYVCDPVTSTV